MKKYELLGIEMSFEEFDRLICEQNKGKELTVQDGKVVAIDHVETEEEKIKKRESYILDRLEELTKDFVQVQCGAIFEDIEDRRKEFRDLHNELRLLEGKEIRLYEEDV